jgi:ABC-2 type transport system permease protein
MIRTASVVLPSTAGIDGLVRVNQMGASLADVVHDWTRLWVLTGIYAVLAIVATRIVTMRRVPDVS